MHGIEKQISILKGKANTTVFHKVIVNLYNEKYNDEEQTMINDSMSITSLISNISCITSSTPYRKQCRTIRTRKADDYQMHLDFPDNFLWMKKYITILPLEIIDSKYLPQMNNDENEGEINKNKNRVCVVLKTLLRRPIDASSLFVVVEKNQLLKNGKVNSKFTSIKTMMYIESFQLKVLSMLQRQQK